jgi:alpha-L-fucosidase
MLPQLQDLIDTYKPSILWTDGDWEHPSDFWDSLSFLVWLFNSSPVKDEIAITDRWGSGTNAQHGGYYTPGYSTKFYLNHKWEENRGIDTYSYGLNRASSSTHYFTSEYLVHLLIRTVAYGGNLLLSVGPASDGTIPTLMQERLLDIGAWLAINGNAIYSTRKWRVQVENSNTVPSFPIYYTAAQPNGTAIFAIATAYPGFALTLATPIFSANIEVRLLGVTGTLLATGTPGRAGITIEVPLPVVGQPPILYAWTFQLLNVS